MLFSLSVDHATHDYQLYCHLQFVIRELHVYGKEKIDINRFRLGRGTVRCKSCNPRGNFFFLSHFFSFEWRGHCRHSTTLTQPITLRQALRLSTRTPAGVTLSPLQSNLENRANRALDSYTVRYQVKPSFSCDFHHHKAPLPSATKRRKKNIFLSLYKAEWAVIQIHSVLSQQQSCKHEGKKL